VIKLRTHIISLTAVFLALGIGLVLGSTFLDRTFVTALDAQVKGLNARLDERNAEADAMGSALDRATVVNAALADAALPAAVAERLDGEEVVVLADNGVDPDQVDAMLDTLDDAGATVPALLRLTERWNVSDNGDTADVAEGLDLPADTPATRVRRSAARTLSEALAAEQPEAAPTPSSGASTTAAVSGASPGPAPTSVAPSTTTSAANPGGGESSSTTMPPRPETPLLAPVDALQVMVEVGLVKAEPVASSELSAPSADALVLIITGEGAVIETDSLMVLVGELARANPGRVLVAEVNNARTLRDEALDDSVPTVGASLADIRADDALAGQLSTLDGAGSVEGRFAAVLALSELSSGGTGDYGLADGDDSVYPEAEQ
jgi:hypothetical protein